MFTVYKFFNFYLLSVRIFGNKVLKNNSEKSYSLSKRSGPKFKCIQITGTSLGHFRDCSETKWNILTTP